MKSSYSSRHGFLAALTCLILTAGVSYGDLVFGFNSSTDTDPWVNAGETAACSSYFISDDAPPGQTFSTGALGITGYYGPGYTPGFGGLQLDMPATNLNVYNYLQFDMKQEGTPDQYNQIQAVQFNLYSSSSGYYSTASIQPTYQGSGPQGQVSTNNGWAHFVIPMSAFTAGASNITRINLYFVDGDYTDSTAVNWGIDNITFSTTLPTAVVSPVILPVYRDATGTNLVVSTMTQSGFNYYLLSTTNLTPPSVWSTNSITSGTDGIITNLVPIDPSLRNSFFQYLVN
ncbi:MAG TPA: hypothetical protein VG938_05285 [Verrucomicrobiae bacterium]|nr:hypothetical protein [Verrucomicrobiae bacterium]